MNTTISAIYQHGAFYPLEPLELPEATLVSVQVAPQKEIPVDDKSWQQYAARLQTTLRQFAKQWSEKIIYQTVVKIFRDDLQTLWVLCPSTHRDLCAMLMLALQHLHTDKLTSKQLEAVNFVLNTIAQPQLTETEIEECHEKLMEAELYLSFTLNDDALQNYLDEL